MLALKHNPTMNFKFLLTLLVGFGLLFSSCSADGDFRSEPSLDSNTGVGGSYARFIIAGDFMYIVDNQDLQTFSLADPTLPALINRQNIGSAVESIFRLNDRLFIGSGIGLFIYGISANGVPQKLGEYFYNNFTFGIEPCDPVVANDTMAYVTLNTGRADNPCGGTTIQEFNLLNIFDIRNILEPQLIAQYPMHRPKGVGLDGPLLFLCDDDAGLKIFDVTNPLAIVMIAHFNDFTAYDVIPLGGLLLVVGPDNIYQFDYSDRNNIRLLANIPYGA
jgi:hypothetical protein